MHSSIFSSSRPAGVSVVHNKISLWAEEKGELYLLFLHFCLFGGWKRRKKKKVKKRKSNGYHFMIYNIKPPSVFHSVLFSFEGNTGLRGVFYLLHAGSICSLWTTQMSIRTQAKRITWHNYLQCLRLPCVTSVFVFLWSLLFLFICGLERVKAVVSHLFICLIFRALKRGLEEKSQTLVLLSAN